MRVFFDTEFLETYTRIYPISIGIVRDDGEELYRQWSSFPRHLAKGTWVEDNVLTHLDPVFSSTEEIARRIRLFVGSRAEWWGYYCAYDWVILCQLYGGMMRLPAGWGMWCRDLKHLASMRGVDPPEQKGELEHHALRDARWIKSGVEYVEAYKP